VEGRRAAGRTGLSGFDTVAEPAPLIFSLGPWWRRRPAANMLSMHTTTASRLALVPLEPRDRSPEPRRGGIVRRYRLGRVVSDLGPALAGCSGVQPAAPSKGERAP
jgi:hypothetical protein